MFSEMSLAPRYRLDDQSPWLKGIDPMRRYWIYVNGEQGFARALPGLKTDDFEAFRQAIFGFRNLTIGAVLTLPTELGDGITISLCGGKLLRDRRRNHSESGVASVRL